MDYNQIMRVKKTIIAHQIVSEYNHLLLSIHPSFQELVHNLQVSQYPGWIEQRMDNEYIVKKILPDQIRFDYQTVLRETDHHQLKKIIQHLLNEFIVYEVTYPSAYDPQIQVFKGQLDGQDMYFSTPLAHEDEKSIIVYFHYQLRERQEIQLKINKLQNFYRELLIYPIRDSFKDKLGIRTSEDLCSFMDTLCQNYSQQIVKEVNDSLTKIGMKANILILSISSFIKEDKSDLSQRGIDTGTYDWAGGFIFDIIGYEESFGKLYIIFQKWLSKLNTTVVEVELIECCKREMVAQYYQQAYSNSHAVLLQPSYVERILIINPQKQQGNELEAFFKTSKRIISGLEYQEQGFQTLIKMWKEFIFESELNLQASVHQDYIMVNCTRIEQKILRDKIARFLQNYSIEEQKVKVFNNQFEIGLFQSIYLPTFKIRNTQFYTHEKCLFVKYYKKDAEAVDKQIRDIYQQMKKELVLVPITKSPSIKKTYFRQSRAADWETTQCLEWQQFKIQDKITVNVRSFGSVSTNEQDCIFVIQDLKDCSQLIDILKGDGYTSYEKRIQQSKGCMGFNLRLCPYFDNITAFKVPIDGNRDNRWFKKLKDTIQSLISDHRNSRHIKFMFPRHAGSSIGQIIPIIVRSLHTSYMLTAQCKIKEATFFVSVWGGGLRSSIIGALRQISKSNISINRIFTSNLQVSDVQKIVTYGYYTLKYFQNQTTLQASPLNSFIFHTQKSKKINVPIFLPEPQQKKQNKQCEYLVNSLEKAVYQVHGSSIQKIPMPQSLQRLKATFKHYFPGIQYFVINGNKQGTQFCRRLFYITNSQKHFNKMEQIKLQKEKIVVLGKFIKFSLIKNQFTQLKRIQTHRSKIGELKALLKAASLQ